MIAVDPRLVTQAADRAGDEWTVGECPVCHRPCLSPQCERHYEYREPSGHAEWIDADDMDDAVEVAEAMCRGGVWSKEGERVDVEVTVTEYDQDGEVTDSALLEVVIPPTDAYLIRCATQYARRSSCGDDPEDHDWRDDQCTDCGLIRVRGGSAPTHYTLPLTWCRWCECEERECDCSDD